MRVAAASSFARVLNPHEGAYILSSTDVVSQCYFYNNFYHSGGIKKLDNAICK